MNLGILGSAFGLGATLGILPGPVQMVLLSESTRGGTRRGLRAMVGANGTFGVLLLGLAIGVAVVSPGSAELRVLRIAGGLFLIFLAADAYRFALTRQTSSRERGQLRSDPLLRGSLSVIFNPGAWVFLATTAAALFVSAQHAGGRPLSIGAAAAMLAGIALIDGSMVLLGGGVRRFEERVAALLAPVLGTALAAFGIVLLVEGIRG